MYTSVNNLVLEVTRRCNMCCEHCLRGDAEDMDMSTDTVDAVLSSVDAIGCVVFSGGEPTLNLPIIEYFFKRANEMGKLPSSFYVVSNGMKNQLELAAILLKWYPLMDEQDMCGAALSIDQFHGDISQADAILKGLAFYRDDKEHPDFSSEAWVLQDRGRANWSGVGRASRPFLPELDVDAYDDKFNIDQLYVSSNGNIVGDCDLPFTDIDEEAVCTIDTLQAHLQPVGVGVME